MLCRFWPEISQRLSAKIPDGYSLARVQSVNRETKPRYWSLINSFRELTGYRVVVNTSFNVRGEPIVGTPEDAYRCFMSTEMDYLVMGNLLFEKASQPQTQDKAYWQHVYELD